MNDTSAYLNDLFAFSDNVKEIYEIINYVALSGLISLFGVITNAMNIIVFFKQGFKTTVNISLFGLAVADLLSLTFMIWFSILKNPLFIYSDIVIWPEEIMHLTAGAPHSCYTRVACWITVFVTAERCLCITLPLKIKQIVTPKRTAVAIIVIYIFNTAAFIPEYSTLYHDWKFIKARNRTLLGLFHTSGYYRVAGLNFFMYSTLGSTSFIGVIIFTVVLVLQLNRKTKWRMNASNNNDQSKSIASRDTKTMTMVVMIATVLIVCNIPGVIVSMLTFAENDLRLFGKYANGFFVLWSFVFVAEAINSSINIFFYYHMSINFKTTFRLTFSCWFQETSTLEDKGLEKSNHIVPPLS